MAPSEHDELAEQLAHVAEGLAEALDDLRELSRGIHPAILSQGGLGPALKALARRSEVPVQLDLAIDQRLTEQVEVGAYYVVSEALTNAAKHAAPRMWSFTHGHELMCSSSGSTMTASAERTRRADPG